MSKIERLILQDDDGAEYTIFVESQEEIALSGRSADESEEDEYEAYGISNEIRVKLSDIHETLQAYARYSIGAFKNITFADIEEMTLRFNIKLAGKAGLPVLAEGSAEGAFEIEVKCKFRDDSEV